MNRFGILIGMAVALFVVCRGNAKTMPEASGIEGQWIILAGMESMGPSPGKESWTWRQAYGRRITITQDKVVSPFSSDKCKNPSFQANTVDALSFYRDNKTPFEALGIHGKTVRETGISCDNDTWSILGIMPLGKGLVVASVQDGGYVIAVKAKKDAQNVQATRVDCKQLALSAAQAGFKGGKLRRAGCWNAGAYAVYAITYTKGKGLPYSTLLYKLHGKKPVRKLLIRSSIAGMDVCDALSLPGKNKKSNGLTSIFSWVKDLDCASSFRSHVGSVHASVVWQDSPKYRVCGFSWKYKGHKGFFKSVNAR